ncbi:MAG: hypothetical protein ACC645_13405 [Pirellulales bacterium]
MDTRIPTGSSLLAVIVVMLVVGAWTADADAKLLGRNILDQTSDGVVVAPDGAAGALTICCEKPCIIYRHHGRCRKVCCTSAPAIKTVLLVKNPADCRECYVEVPVCIPACCTQPPCVVSRCGLFGRGIVDYEYPCGFRIRVIFRRSGDVVVHTFGS